MESIWLFALFGALIVAGILFGRWKAEQRKQALSAWSQQNGLAFDPARRHGLDAQFSAFNVLKSGSNRYGFNFMTGNWKSWDIVGFDYHYETHSTDSKGRHQTHHHHFSAAVVASKWALKPLLIRPEGVFDKIKDFFGYNDIDFESAEFSRRFHVSAPDERWAYDVLHARAIEYLLAQTRYTIQLDTSHIIVYRGGKLFAPEDFENAASVVIGLLEQLPNYLQTSHSS